MSKIPTQLHPGYQTLVENVLPHLTHYTQDITEYDQKALIGYKGDFISMYRQSGTNLFLLDSMSDAAAWDGNKVKESIENTQMTALLYVEMNNEYLFVSANGESKKLTKEECVDLLEKRQEKALNFFEDFKKINFPMLALEVTQFMAQYGKRWKSKLKEDWFRETCSSEARRLRNLIGEDGLKSIQHKDDEVVIKKALVNFYMKGR